MPISLTKDKQHFILPLPGLRSTREVVCSRIFPYRIDKERTLLLNALSGSIDVVDRRESRLMGAAKEGALRKHPDLRRYLLGRRYLFRSAAEEAWYFKKVCEAASYASGIIVHLFVTSFCNFDCPYCFERNRTQQHRHCDASMIRRAFAAIGVIRQALEIPPKGVEVKLFGGEPLLRNLREAVLEALALCRRHGYRCNITTNGYDLDAYISDLERFRDIIEYLHVTVDGPRVVHDRRRHLLGGGGTYKRIVQNIDEVLKRKVTVVVRTNVDRETAPHLQALVKMYVRKGWNERENFRMQLIPVFDMTESLNVKGRMDPESTYRRILPLLQYVRKKFRHPPLGNYLTPFGGDYLAKALRLDVAYELAPGDVKDEAPPFVPMTYFCASNRLRDLCFYPDGNIYPCAILAGIKEAAIGAYVPEVRFDRRKCQQWMRRSVQKMSPCDECRVSTMCGGGCVAAEMESGLPVKEAVCTKNRYEAFLKRFLDSHKKHIIRRIKDSEMARS